VAGFGPREQWIARHVARAPKITPQQCADTLLLYTRNRQDDESGNEKKAS